MKENNQVVVATPIFEKKTIGLWVYDVTRQTIDWSRGMYDIHDAGPEEARRNLQDRVELSLACYAPGCRQEVLSSFERCLEFGEPYDLECEFTSRCGRRLWVRTMGHAITRDGKIVRVVGCLIDQTEQKLARERFHEESQRRLVLMDASRDGIAIINQHHRIVEANSRFADMLGYSVDELPGLHTWQYEAVLSESKIREDFRDLSSANSVFETRHRRKDGTVFDVEVCVSGALVNGEPLVLTICRDITDRKNAEKALRQSETKFRQAFQTNPDPAVITRLEDGTYVDVNQAFIDQTGYTREQVIGKTSKEFNFWSDFSERQHLYDQLLEKGAIHNMEAILYENKVRPVPALVSAAIFDFNGEPHIYFSAKSIEKQKSAESRLRTSEERNRKILHTAMDGFCRIDRRGKILEVNQAYCRMTGYTAEELLAMSIRDLDSILNDEDVERYLQIIVDQGEARFESQQCCKDGRCIEVEVSAQYRTTKAGAEIVSFLRDITARKQAERLLHQFNRELHAINECRQALIRAQEENELLCNICRIICHTAQYRMAWVCMLDDEDPASYRPVVWHGHEEGYLGEAQAILRENFLPEAPLRRVLQTNQTAFVHDFNTDEKVVPLKEAALKRGYQSSIYLPLKDENSRIFGTLNIYSDHPHAFTPKETELLEGLANDLAYGIVFLRVRAEQERNIRANTARVDLIRFAQSHSLKELLEETLNVAESLTGSSIGFYHFIHEDQGKILLQAWSKRTKEEFCTASDTSQHYDIEVAGVWVDCLRQRRPVIHNDYKSLPHRRGLPAGHADVVRYLTVPVIRGEKIRAILGVGNKSSPYVRKDIEIVHLLADFAWEIVERKIEEDKREEVEIQLRQAQKMEAIGTLAGGIAHDFNNILNAIMGFAEMAYDDAKAGHADPSDIAQVLKASERAKGLVQQILTFSRKVEVIFKPLSLNKLIEQTLQLLRNTIPRMIELKTDLASGLWTITADANQIEQILLNLTVNALDALPGGGLITIKTGNITVFEQLCMTCGQRFSGPYATLEISDNGQGIDRKTMKHIFEPFFTTKEMGKGTGLGLSTVYGIVMGHKGHVICRSAPGEGTVFTVFFPVLSGQDTHSGELSAAAPGPAAAGSERILIVDDEEAIVRIVSRQLSRHGYQTLTANCGESALELYRARQSEVDLVIMDLSMPGLGGFRTLRELLEINPLIKVIIVSGYATDGQISDSLEVGAAAYIIKPFNQAELLATVRRILDQLEKI